MFNAGIVEELLPSVKREAAIETELIMRVRALGGIAEKTTVIGRRGFFDRVVVLPGGRVVFVECKRPKGRGCSGGLFGGY